VTEATFPLLGTALVVLIVLPAFALLAKAGLLMLERDEVGGPLHGLNLRYVLLTGSSVLPHRVAVSPRASTKPRPAGRRSGACSFTTRRSCASSRSSSRSRWRLPLWPCRFA
jgi:hypothetical protein